MLAGRYAERLQPSRNTHLMNNQAVESNIVKISSSIDCIIQEIFMIKKRLVWSWQKGGEKMQSLKTFTQ